MRFSQILIPFWSPFAFVSELPSPRWDDPVVTLPYGTYKGYHNESNGIDVWRSLRYAASTAGENRWRAPQPPLDQSDDGVIDASEWPKQCVHSSAGDNQLPDSYNPLQPSDDEDCLFLSLFKPSEAKDLPVYVWLHGGGWAFNSAQEFDAQPMIDFSNNSIISVTVQYRLGIFGYLASPQMGDGLNAGLRDAAAALQWVQDYIHLFGGDPNQVTVGGESAGASFVLNLLAAQSVEGRSSLFNYAYAASPAMRPQGDCATGFWKQQWEEISSAAGCYDDISCMRNASVSKLRILNSDYSGFTTRGHNAPLAICIEGPEGYTTESAVAKLYAGKTTPAVVVAGNNYNDSYQSTTTVTPSPYSPTFQQDANKLFTGYFNLNWPIRDNDTETLKKLLDVYPLGDFDNNYDRVAQAAQDVLFACPGDFAAAAHNGSGYKFLYSVPPAYHAQDNAQEYPWFYSQRSPDSPSFYASFIGSLVSLVKTGNPSGLPFVRPAEDPEWPTWGTDRQFKVFNVSSSNISEAYAASSGNQWEYRIGLKERCQFWGELRTRDQW